MQRGLNPSACTDATCPPEDRQFVAAVGVEADQRGCLCSLLDKYTRMYPSNRKHLFGSLLLAYLSLVSCHSECPAGTTEQSGFCRATPAADSGSLDSSDSSVSADEPAAPRAASSMQQSQPQRAEMSECSSGMACDTGCGECCADTDCPDRRGFSARCSTSLTCQYTCPDGALECAGECVPGAQCCRDQDCGARDGRAGKCDRSTRQCAWTCESGSQPCGGACIAMDACCDANSCEGGFECVAGQCSSSQCQPGKKLCGTSCIREGDCCSDVDCAGNFVCSASGVCSSTVCSAGHKLCRGECIAQDACCVDSECGNARSCVEQRCRSASCPAGSILCDDACLSAPACCADADCSGGHACVGRTCSPDRCVDGMKACAAGSCIPADGCCADADCKDGKSCVSGSCSGPCQTGYVSCSSGACTQLQGACVATVFVVDPGADCTTNVCIPEAEVCKTNPFRRVFKPSNDLDTLATLCEPEFPAMRQSICAAPELAGRADVMVRFIVDQYNAQGDWQANANLSYTSCAP
jgi:hypothetical protein